MTVQHSIQKMVSDGTLSTIALGIQYLQRNDIYMRIAGEETPQSGAPSGYTWSFINNTTLKILPVVPNGVEVVVHRRTDVDAMYNIYSQNAQFDEATIDENNQQLLYIAQEYLEQGLPGTGIESLEYINTIAGINYYHFKLTDGSYTPVFGVPDGTVTLRAELSAPSGSGTIGFEQAGSGSVARTSQNKMRERITPQDKGAVGDGVTNDQAAFDALEAMVGDIQVDMLGKTYLVTTYPSTQKYFNGFFKVGTDTLEANRYLEGYTRGKNTVVGAGAAPSLPSNPATSVGTANVVVGEEALRLGVNTRSSIAIGTRAMYNATDGKYNIAVGLESMYYVNADGSQFGGTRNVAVGDNSGRFITKGYQNIMMGRNAGQCMVLGYHNVTLGTDAMAGRGSLKFSDSQFIQNQTPYNTADSVAVGYSASYFGAGNNSTSVGSRALGYAKYDASNCNAFGKDALLALGSKTGIHGNVQVLDTRSGTYVMTGTDVTFTLPSHGLSVGWYVVVSFTSGVPYIDGQYYQIAQVVDANTFKVSEPLGIATSGAFSMVSYETAVNQATCTRNTAIGSGSMNAVDYGTENIAIGTNSMAVNTGGSYNTSVGDLSMRNLVASSFNTAMGYLALQNKVDGTPMTSATNCTGIGYNARVSGNDQIQLGNAATTTYVFGTVQNRSDARDKTDVRDTSLGIEFIMGLRPVDGRWDLRDDYWEEYDEQVGVDAEGLPVFETKRRQLPKDGSKARQRKHHWFIAQEVKELCDSLGVEFGGYQDHSVNGGCDVLTLGYDEFIPPAVKAVQQCWTRLNAIEARIAKLEA